MSSCRWSSDDFRCDLYVYGADDGVVIHVASRRHAVPEADYPPPVDLTPESTDAWLRRHEQVMALIEKAPLEPIGLPLDGEDFHGLSYRDAAEKVRELIALGYRCDPSVADELEAEAAALPPTGEPE